MAITSYATGAYAATRNLTQAMAKGAASSGAAAVPTGGTGGAGGGFADMLTNALDGVAQSSRKAETQAMSAAGGKANLVDVVTAVAESETALQTLVAVRDRVISAYEEIMRMPI